MQKLLKVPFYIEKNSTIEFLTRDFVFRAGGDIAEEEKTQASSKDMHNPLQLKQTFSQDEDMSKFTKSPKKSHEESSFVSSSLRPSGDFNPYLFEQDDEQFAFEDKPTKPAPSAGPSKKFLNTAAVKSVLAKSIETGITKGKQGLSKGITKVDEFLMAPVNPKEKTMFDEL